MPFAKTKKIHDPYAALRFVDFRRYTLTNFLLIFGNQMVSTSLGWELYAKTGRALDLGLMGLSVFLPTLFLAPLGGNVADRYDRRKILVLFTLIYILDLIALCFISAFRAEIVHFNWAVFGFLFMTGACNAFYNPAKQSLLPQLVSKQAIPNAVTWSSSVFQLASVIGPAACGLLLGHHIPNFAIYASAVFFESLFLLALLSLDLRKIIRSKVTLSMGALAEGAKFVWNTKPILATITLDLFAVLLGGCTALLPIFVKEILHSGPETLGWLRTAPALGAFGMAILVTRKPMKRPGLVLLWAVAGFGAATIIFGLSRNLGLSLSMMVVIGALDNISVIVRGSLVQVLTPNRLLGRVQAVNYLFIYSSNELGAFESGTMAAILNSAVASVVLGGIGSIFIVLGVAYLWPQVAGLRSLHDPLGKKIGS